MPLGVIDPIAKPLSSLELIKLSPLGQRKIAVVIPLDLLWSCIVSFPLFVPPPALEFSANSIRSSPSLLITLILLPKLVAITLFAKTLLAVIPPRIPEESLAVIDLTSKVEADTKLDVKVDEDKLVAVKVST